MVSTAHSDEYVHLLDVSRSQQREPWNILPRWTRMQWRVMLITAFLMLSVTFGHFLGTAPQLKIFEDIICENYKQSFDQVTPHANVSFDVNICKSEPVQSELALITGWKNTFDVLPALALTMPYGVLADKIGRRPFIMLSIAATALSECWPRVLCWFNWPLRLSWLTGMFQAPGGGDQFGTFMLMTIIVDVFNEEQRATALYCLVSLSTIAEVVATPISATTMTINPWIPFMLGPMIILVGAIFSTLVPETLDESKRRPTLEDHDERVLSRKRLICLVISKAKPSITETEFIWKNPKVLISLTVVFAGILDKSSLFLLIQYASTKYRWTISQASYLILIRGCMTLLTFLVLMPLLSSFLIRRLHCNTLQKDLNVSKVAAICGIIGYLLIFIACDPLPLIIGCLLVSLSMPFVVAIVSVATSFTPADHIASLYTAISMSQSIGIIVAGPVFAKLYAAGLHIGVQWSGLPFAVAASLFAVILIPLMFLEPGS